MKKAKMLFISVTLLSIVSVTLLSLGYVEYWNCLTNLDLSISNIEVSPIEVEATEVDEVMITLTFHLANPTVYTELKIQQAQIEIRLDNVLILLRNILMDVEIDEYSDKPITSVIEVTGVTGEKLSLLKDASLHVWSITCVLQLEGLLGQTRRVYSLSYNA